MAASVDGADVCRWKRFLNKLVVAGDAPANEHVDSVATLFKNSLIPRPEQALGMKDTDAEAISAFSGLHIAAKNLARMAVAVIERKGAVMAEDDDDNMSLCTEPVVEWVDDLDDAATSMSAFPQTCRNG